LIKGGHFQGNETIDLFYDGKEFLEICYSRINIPEMHGLGCSLSGLITAFVASGQTVKQSVLFGIERLKRALYEPINVGKGMSILTKL